MELPKKKPVFNANANKKEAPVVSKQATPNPIAKNKKSEILLNKNVKGILPNTVLSEEDKLKIAKKKEQTAKLACILKQVATFLGIGTVLLALFMNANTSKNNVFLSKLGIDKNIGSISNELESENLKLEIDTFTLDNKIAEFKKKIENKHYTLFSEEIKKIRDSQLAWFDKTNKEGELIIGIFDGVNKIAEYLNDRNYQDPSNIISGKYGKVLINNVSANRNSISFSAKTTHILGKIIFMDIEFIDVLNSFPIYKNGQQLSSFTREKNEEGDYFTEFSMSLDIQKSNEEDPADEKFTEYINWFKNKYPNITLINYKNTNK